MPGYQRPCVGHRGNRYSHGATTVIQREGGWLLGCALVATLYCWLLNEYGLSAAPFFTVAFYVLSGIVRLILHLAKRFSR